MDINLLDKKKLDDWLKQFDSSSLKSARKLIEDINFIDQVDYDFYTNNLVSRIEKEIKGYKDVYIVPINSLNLKKVEPKSDSAFVFNIKKKFNRKGNLFWSLDRKIERNSIVFFVDEFVGSGGTMVNNISLIDEVILKRIRSLTSLKKVKVCILSIVLYLDAEKYIKSKFSFINDYIYEVKGTYFDKDFICNSFSKYLRKQQCIDAKFGYGNICSNIVFYNNCPNNTPSILWCKQTSKRSPLFVDKKVKLNYKTAYFNLKSEYIRLLKYIEEDMEFQEEILIMKKISRINGMGLLIDTILFLFLRKKFKIKEKFLYFSKINDIQFKKILNCCSEYGLISCAKSNSRLTALGKKIIIKFESLHENIYQKNSDLKDNKVIDNKVKMVYYPTQIKGIKIDV